MTITEIAQRAGVSKACVSRYFNHGYVSEEKKEKIRRVVQETGYIPTRGTQGTAPAKKRTIAVVIPKINSESISRMVAGISHELSREGYRMLLADTHCGVVWSMMQHPAMTVVNTANALNTRTRTGAVIT